MVVRKMDPRIWRHLPDHLLDLVLSFLSLKAFLSLTPTCKHFTTLLSSPLFLSKHATSSLPSSLLLSHPQFRHRFPLFDSALSVWRTLALPLPSRYHHAPLLCSASRGLLCFSLPHLSSFLVSSGLLSGPKRVVKTPFFDMGFDSATLVCTPMIGFRIFLLCSSSSSSNFAYVYDSVIDRWTRFDRVGSVLIGNHHQEGVFYNGYLYFVTPEPFSVVYFDLETGNWGVGTLALPIELTFARLVSDGGDKLYLIGGIGQHGISRGIKIWELSENGNDWVEIESLPDMICKKFMSICYHNYEHVYCFWHQGLICVCCYNWPEVLYYKVSRMTWHWLPKNPSLPDKWSFGFRWFSLVPEIHTFI